MSSNKPSTNISLVRTSAPNPYNPFITPNRSHIVTRTQEEDPLEILTCAFSMSKADYFSPTIFYTLLFQHLTDTFTEPIPVASLTPKEHTTTPNINSPLKDRFRVNSSKLTEDKHLRKRDITHLFQLNSYSKARSLDCAFMSWILLSFLRNKTINGSIV